jgi:hypothetical protein
MTHRTPEVVGPEEQVIHARSVTGEEEDCERTIREIEERNQALDDILRQAEKRTWNETPPLPS